MHPQDYADLCAHLSTAPWATNYYPTMPGGETVAVLFDPTPDDPRDERMAVQILMYNGRGPDGKRNWPRDREMREYAKKDMGTERGSGMDLVLADIRTRVNHKAVELYGEAPKSSGRARAAKQVRIDNGAVGVGRQAANNVDLGTTKVTQGRGSLPSAT